MKKKWLSLLLAVLCLCGLAACKGDTPADTAPPDAPAQVETGTGGEAAEDSVEAAAGVAEEDISAAEHYVNNLPLESQVAQMFFARCPEADAAVLAGQYDIGGYILFGRDFEGQTKESVAAVIQSYQDAAATPMLIGVDEEGGTVVRISSNPNFRADRFWSVSYTHLDVYKRQGKHCTN